MKLKYSTIFIAGLFIQACTTLQVSEFRNSERAENKPNLTGYTNFQRNAVSAEEIALPLSEIWHDSYGGLPAGGFSAVDNWLIYAAKNGTVGVIDTRNGEELDKKKLGTSCNAAPTIQGNILYQSFEAGSDGLIAYDLVKGAEIWHVEKRNSRAAPIVTDNMVFLQEINGTISAWNAITGENIWEKKRLFKQSFASPAYANNTVIAVGLSGKVAALDHASGVLVWSAELGEPVMAEPVIYENQVFISSLEGSIVSFDIGNGKKINSIHTDLPQYHGPTVRENVLYLAMSNGHLRAYDLDNYLKIWEFAGSGPSASSAAVTEQYVLFGTLDRYFYILDRATGTSVQDMRLERRIRSIPLIHQNKLFIAVENNSVYAYETAN